MIIARLSINIYAFSKYTPELPQLLSHSTGSSNSHKALEALFSQSLEFTSSIPLWYMIAPAAFTDRMSQVNLFLERGRTKHRYLQCRCTAFKILALIYSYSREPVRLEDGAHSWGRKIFNTFRRINCWVYGALWGGTRPSLSIGLSCRSENRPRHGHHVDC